MKKLIPIIIMATLLLVVACGGDDNEKEETPTPTGSPTATLEPTQIPTETVEPTESPIETTEPTPSPTETMEPTVSPTETAEPTASTGPADSAEMVLEDVLPNLVLAIAEVDGKWQGYAGPNTSPLGTLENGQVYWWYAPEDISVPWSPTILYQGWNMGAWISDTESIATALEDYSQSLPFVVKIDSATQQVQVYQSPDTENLATISPGQTYITLVWEPGSPMPEVATHTR